MDESYLSVLPPELCAGIRSLAARERAALQEIRLRCGQTASCLIDGRERVVPSGTKGYYVEPKCLEAIVNKATGYSRYASGEQLRQGFLTLPGGHRLGLCGQAVCGEGGVRTLRELSSVNLRIAGQHRGSGAQASTFLRRFPVSTLIAGPPGCGKTTLLRELIRTVSDGMGQRVGVADERFELAACHGGMPGFDLGRMTDVLPGARKHEAIYMLLRTMNPDWIVLDEITEDRDVDALLRSSFCGVRILASAHVFSRDDLTSRPLYARMCGLGIFENLMLMDKRHGVKPERMVTNDQTAGCGPDRAFGGYGGDPHGAERPRRGPGAAAAQAGAGADAVRDPGQSDARPGAL